MLLLKKNEGRTGKSLTMLKETVTSTNKRLKILLNLKKIAWNATICLSSSPWSNSKVNSRHNDRICSCTNRPLDKLTKLVVLKRVWLIYIYIYMYVTVGVEEHQLHSSCGAQHSTVVTSIPVFCLLTERNRNYQMHINVWKYIAHIVYFPHVSGTHVAFLRKAHCKG